MKRYEDGDLRKGKKERINYSELLVKGIRGSSLSLVHPGLRDNERFRSNCNNRAGLLDGQCVVYVLGGLVLGRSHS